MQSVHITTTVVSSNLNLGDVYSIQHYVIKFVNGLLFSPVSSSNKNDIHEIIEVLLKVALSTIDLKPKP